MKTLRRLLGNKDGATSIEYAIIASMIGLTIISGATSIATELGGVFDSVTSGFSKKGG